jgi:probable phosphoglycerate mutase
MSFFQDSDLQVIIVKPGATDLDEQGRIVGSLDVPLSQSGQRQAKEAAAELANVKLKAVYCCPSLAAQQTAVEITVGSRVKVRVDANLTNMDYGLWHGKEIKEVFENHPKLVRQWADNPAIICPPHGETTTELEPRVDSFLKKITRKHKSGVVVIVAPDPLASIIAGRIDDQHEAPTMCSEPECGTHEMLNMNPGFAL